MPVQHDGTFESFARTPEYVGVNTETVRRWIAQMRLGGVHHIRHLLDIATGVGTMVELFLTQMPKEWPKPNVLCVDKSEEALQLAQAHLGLPAEQILLVHTKAEELSLPPNVSVDTAVWGNGIHYLSVEAQRAALERIKNVLQPGGGFFFNTTFHKEARPENTQRFYAAQVSEAVRLLRDRGIQRDKEAKRPDAGAFLPESHYLELVKQIGFTLVDVHATVVRTSLSFWEAICGYYHYSAGALHGYDLKEATAALQQGVKIAFEKYAIPDANGAYIPRVWLSASARRV